MRTLRLLVGLSAVGSLIAAVATGCSSSDTPAAPGGGDSDASIGHNDGGNTGTDSGNNTGTDGSTNVDSAIPTSIAITGADLNVYLGQIAQLDVTGTAATPAATLTYAWTVDTVPAGSAVVSSSIFNAGSAKPSFTPDKLGDYTLKVVVTGGGATATKTLTVKAFEAQSVFLYTDGDGGTFGRMGVRAAATITDAGSRDLSCHVWDAGPYDGLALSDGTVESDAWEGPAGGDSKVAYVHQVHETDGGTSNVLMVVSTASTCATAPAQLDKGDGIGAFLLQPRFSPNGQRVAYVRQPNTPTLGDAVMTVGADGTTRRAIGAFAARPDGGPFPDAGVADNQSPPQVLSPRWLNDTKVGWLQFTSGKAWNIVVSDDVDNGNAALYMSCASVTGDKPTQFAFMPDGSVIVAQRVAYNEAGTKFGARDLLVYAPNATTKACELVRNLTQQESDGGTAFSSATDFSLSPDGTQVAYVDFDHTVDAGTGPAAYSIWTVAVNGLTPPAPLAGAPKRGALPTVGPRWLAGGALLAWPQEQRTVDAGATAAQAIVVAPAGGGSARIVGNSATNKGVFAIGNGSACSIAAAGGSGLAAFGALGALVGLVARRRRR